MPTLRLLSGVFFVLISLAGTAAPETAPKSPRVRMDAFPELDSLMHAAPLHVAVDGVAVPGDRTSLARGIFDRLYNGGAGFPTDPIRFEVRPDADPATVPPGSAPRDGPEYDPRARTISVPQGFLDKHGGNERIMATMLGHELGHPLQPLGTLDRSNRKRFEAQADMLGLRITGSAGVPPRDFSEGLLDYYKYGHIRWPGLRGDSPDHPDPRTRFLNAAAYGPLISPAGPDGPLLPVPGLDAFKPDGTVIPNRLVPEPVVRNYALAAVEALGAPEDANRRALAQEAERAVRASLDRFVEPPGIRNLSAPAYESVEPVWDLAKGITSRMALAARGEAPIAQDVLARIRSGAYKAD